MKPSIYRQLLGADFERLHPKIQERFDLTSESGVGFVGRGVMERVWHGPFWTLPFLYLGTWRRIMFPEQGENLPFTIRNFAYVDCYGRETVTWVRSFELERPRRFDAYMVFDPEREIIVDYLGTHQHLAVDLEMSVADNGGVQIRSTEQRFYEGPIAFRFPLICSGEANVQEWFDDEEGRYRIRVEVKNRRWGPLFGYEGWFENEIVPCEELPEDLRPKREEKRF